MTEYVIKANDPKFVVLALAEWARIRAAACLETARKNPHTATSRRMGVEASVYNTVAEFLRDDVKIEPAK